MKNLDSMIYYMLLTRAAINFKNLPKHASMLTFTQEIH